MQVERDGHKRHQSGQQPDDDDGPDGNAARHPAAVPGKEETERKMEINTGMKINYPFPIFGLRSRVLYERLIIHDCAVLSPNRKWIFNGYFFFACVIYFLNIKKPPFDESFLLIICECISTDFHIRCLINFKT